MKEIWKDVAGYEGLYQVSNKGRVKSLDHVAPNNHFHKGQLLKQRCDKNGYLIVGLSNGKHKWFKVHRLVALAFIPNPQNYPTVNHKNEIKTCNEVWNLEWMTVKDNNNHGTRKYRISVAQKGKSREYAKGEKNYFYGKRFCGKDNVTSKKVYQYSLDGQFINVFDCVREAAKAIGVSNGMISMVCRGERSQTKGYLLKYSPIKEVQHGDEKHKNIA